MPKRKDKIVRGKKTLWYVYASSKKKVIEAQKRSWKQHKPYLMQRVIKKNGKYRLYVGA